jgi:hypothetical protein
MRANHLRCPRLPLASSTGPLHLRKKVLGVVRRPPVVFRLIRSRRQVGVSEDNLPVREDPHRGFYVEGLQQFTVRNFEEAIALLNWGLENRVIGCTRMNATSSRSHTVLTVHIHQHLDADDEVGERSYMGKLMLVDLAGSERIRRTTSR